MNTWLNLSFQDANSPLMEHLIFFHDSAMIILILIIILISYLILTIIINKFINRFLIQGHMIEILWTIMPMIILLMMVFPSLKILYMMDDLNNIMFSIKTLGHQWYWSYEYSDFNKKLEYNSFMKNYLLNDFRLLDTDNRLIIPYNNNIRMLVSSMDVIHSWTIPSLGIKIDATPGRINQILLIMNRPGLYFGQCSEICGTNHSFMPIVVESTSFNNFMVWINSSPQL